MAHEHYASRSHPEFVVLEIGDDLGALIVHADADMHGVEVEISPSGADWQRTHKQVLERFMGGRSAHTLVFDQLPAGRYTLWAGDQPKFRDIVIRAGEITECRWATARPVAA
jgi:hypothetical protein